MFCNMVLCNASVVDAEKGIEGNNSWHVFESVTKNARVVLEVEDIEDEVFWNGIFCLLRAVFPALKALRYCDLNVQLWIRYFSLVDNAIEKSSSMLND